MGPNTNASTQSSSVDKVKALESPKHKNSLDTGERRGMQGHADDRVRDLISFLDQTASNLLPHEGKPDARTETVISASSNAMLLSKISALEVELEDKEHSLKTLREFREREKLREENARKQLLLQLREEITKTTEKYEQQLRRQQELLNQVQDEKKDAVLRCDRLTDELRELEQKFSAKAAEMHKQYGRELDRQRKAFLSGEKARREAWERDRAQEIKDITIKGLEPEIQRLLEKHRSEKRSLEERLKKLAIDMKSKLEEEVASQKAVLARQMQETIEVERSQHRQEIRDLQDNFDSQLRKERELLSAKLQQEANKWESEAKLGKKSMEGAITKAREEEKLRCKKVASKMAQEMDLMKQNHIEEARQAAAAAKARQDETVRAMEAAKASAVQAAIAATKKEVEAECNRKLDHLLERLSREQMEVQTRFEQQCNEAVAAAHSSADQMRQEFLRERQKLESELKAAREERLGLERHISRLETEAELREKLRAELQLALDEASGRAQAVKSETESKTQALKTEWERDKKRCEQQEQELETQKGMLESLNAQLHEAKRELEGMKKQEAERLEKLETKVKGTLFAKDQIIQRLKDELSASTTKVDHLRGLMNKHRSELMQSSSSCESFPIDSMPSTAASLLSPAEKSASDASGGKSTLRNQQSAERSLRGKFTRLQAAARSQLDLKTLQKKL
ncbi:hypothetical protein Efla_003948 [Eimeria flavescens]